MESRPTSTTSDPGVAGEALGITTALSAAALFSTSGVLLKPLLDAGWSPAVAVATRTGIAGLLLAVPAALTLGGRFRTLLEHWKLILGYGLIAVAGTQVLYFIAIQSLPIAVALLIQYSAPAVILLGSWVARRARVTVLGVAGLVASVTGLVLVVGPTDAAVVTPTAILIAFAAALCLAGYYLISAVPTPRLHPIALIGSGLIVGTIAIALVGAAGLLPLSAAFIPARFAGADVPWWVLILAVALGATAAAYGLSMSASRRLGSRLASFLGLSEVLFAIALAWLTLGQVPTGWQLIGAALIVCGVVLVRLTGGGGSTPVARVPVAPEG